MMTNSLDVNAMFDADSGSPSTFYLKPQEIDEAIALSKQVRGPEQWQVYRQAIALSAFQGWIEEREPQLSVNDTHATIHSVAYSSLIGAVCKVQIGPYHICLIPIGSVTDTVASVPRAAMEFSDLVPHLYVLVEILEEVACVKIRGCLRRDSLIYHLQSTLLSKNVDWTYAVPLDWFSLEPDRLLLYLRCLEPTAFSSPTVPLQPPAPVAQFRDDLMLLNPRIQSSDRPIWRLLTWEQASSLLHDPELLHQVYPTTSAQMNGLQDLKQRAINVQVWLQNQMDEFAQDWNLLPSPVLRIATAEALRSPVEQFDDVISALVERGMSIPGHARGAYRDLQWDDVALRLYAVTWDRSGSSHPSEWTLLLMLGAQPGTQLPAGVRLRVQDNHQLLDEQFLEQPASDAHLFSQVMGDIDEQFWVTVDLSNGAVVTLQPFTFHLP